MKSFREFIAEARRLKFITVYRGDDENTSKEFKKNKNVKPSEYGVYGPGVYASSDVNVARHYSGTKNSNVGITKSRIPAEKIKTIRTPEHNHPEGIQQSREIMFGVPGTSVRIKNAASEQERRSHSISGKPNKKESDYFVVNSDTFNRGITTQPIIRAPGKPRRTRPRLPRKR